MELIFRPKFDREFDKISNREIVQKLKFILKQIETASDISQIGGLKKLREYSHFYRIKIKISTRSDYRLVLMIRNNKVWAESIAHVSRIFYKK